MNMSDPSIDPAKKELLWLTHLELLLVVTIWAGTFVSTKIVLTQITPAVSALYRYVVASGILLFVNRGNTERIARTDYPSLLGLGLTGVTLYYLLQHYGIKYTNAVDAAVLISLSPLFIVIISWALLKERLKATTATGLFLALAGSVLVISNGRLNWDGSDARLWGDILILLTAVSWAIYSVYGKKLLQKYSPKTIITYTTVIGTLFLLPFSWLEAAGKHNFILDWFGWLNMLYLGGAASVYGYLAWYRGLTRLPAVTVGSYLYFRPLLTGIIAFIVLRESVGLFTVLGGGLIIAGTYLAIRQ